MRFSMFSAQLTTLRYRSGNLLADLNLNIPVNNRECFSVNDFLDTLCYASSGLYSGVAWFESLPGLILRCVVSFASPSGEMSGRCINSRHDSSFHSSSNSLFPDHLTFDDSSVVKKPRINT